MANNNPESGTKLINDLAEARQSLTAAQAKFVGFLQSHRGSTVRVEGFPGVSIFSAYNKDEEDGKLARICCPVTSIMDNIEGKPPETRSITGSLEVGEGDVKSFSVTKNDKDDLSRGDDPTFIGYVFSLANVRTIEIVPPAPLGSTE